MDLSILRCERVHKKAAQSYTQNRNLSLQKASRYWNLEGAMAAKQGTITDAISPGHRTGPPRHDPQLQARARAKQSDDVPGVVNAIRFVFFFFFFQDPEAKVPTAFRRVPRHFPIQQ
jgi:hypothetical protein